jgi:hypothetical protein
MHELNFATLKAVLGLRTHISTLLHTSAHISTLLHTSALISTLLHTSAHIFSVNVVQNNEMKQQVGVSHTQQ